MDAQETNDSRLTVAIIGAGEVGTNHAEAFARGVPRARIIGIADIDESRATRLAATCEVPAFIDYRRLLELSPDIAVICLPHHLHCEAAMLAAAAGSHILMEKPIAHTLDDAHRIVDACRQHGVRLAVGFVHRYRVEFRYVHDLITTGQVGTPAMVVDTFCMQGGRRSPAWIWHKRFAGGGPLTYTGAHSIDRLRWLLDSEVEEVYARTLTYSQDVDVEDGLTATLVFANGCIGTLIETAPSYLVTPRFWDTQIYGSRARIRIRSGEHLEYSSEDRAYRLEVARDDPFLSQARDFVDAVHAGRDPWIGGGDGLRSLEVTMAIYRSAEQGQPVRVADVARAARST